MNPISPSLMMRTIQKDTKKTRAQSDHQTGMRPYRGVAEPLHESVVMMNKLLRS
jgi:hypothetical protein